MPLVNTADTNAQKATTCARRICRLLSTAIERGEGILEMSGWGNSSQRGGKADNLSVIIPTSTWFMT
jgi:hypothetical protein